MGCRAHRRAPRTDPPPRRCQRLRLGRRDPTGGLSGFYFDPFEFYNAGHERSEPVIGPSGTLWQSHRGKVAPAASDQPNHRWIASTPGDSWTKYIHRRR